MSFQKNEAAAAAQCRWEKNKESVAATAAASKTLSEETQRAANWMKR